MRRLVAKDRQVEGDVLVALVQANLPGRCDSSLVDQDLGDTRRFKEIQGWRVEGGRAQLAGNFRLGFEHGNARPLDGQLVGQCESDGACAQNDDVFARMHYESREGDYRTFKCKFNGRLCNRINPISGSLGKFLSDKAHGFDEDIHALKSVFGTKR